MPETVSLLLTFGLVCLASHRIGRWFTAIGLPYITGYLAAGAVAGVFVLDVLPSGAADELRFVDEISLGVIAFVAGSELYLPDLRRRLRTIVTMSAGVTVVGAVLIGSAVYVLTGVLSFTADLDGPERLATALLGAAVLLALSPPSTIAVIKEVGARGPFTSTALSVTIVMDVVVVVAFATAASVAAALIQGTSLGVGFAGVLALDIALAVGLGIALGRLLGVVLRQRLPQIVTAAVVLALGFGVYELAGVVDAWSVENLPFEIYIEPLLLTMVAGFTVTNLTDQRAAFEEVLHEIGPAVYVAFFTLTGVSLKLDTLLAVLPAAAGLFVVRMGAIYAGTAVGARLAGASADLRTRSWLALITQAGIALGLAREAGLQFPSLGSAFTTLIIAVVVLNEVLGPMFLKRVLTRVGEAAADAGSSVVIHGDDRTADLLATRLADDGWRVDRARDPAEFVAVTAGAVGSSAGGVAGGGAAAGGDGAEVVAATTGWSTGTDGPGDQESPRPDVVVALAGDDEDNLRVCAEAAATGVPTIIAKVRDAANIDAFHAHGAVVVDPTTADVTLLEAAVRTPDTATLIVDPDDARTTRQVTVRSAGGRRLRDLRLPQDVLVMTVRHGRTSLVPDGFTRIHDGDRLTLVGPTDALAEAAARLAD